MSSLFKSIFNFPNDKDLQMNSKITKVEGLIRDLQRQKYHDLPGKVKLILNTLLKQQKGESLFQLAYQTSSKQSPVQWVSVIGKIVGLLSPSSTFMRMVLSSQDYKIPIQKYLIPNYLLRNNILNQKSGYMNITNSISGMIVPLLDYVFIRLVHAIHELEFIQCSKQPNQELQCDDMYYYISRNPYLLLLREYLQFFSDKDKGLKRLTGNIKMYFVDDVLIKHRINKSSSYLRDFSFLSSNSKIRPHYFLVIFLLLKKGRAYFEEKDLYFSEVIRRFSSLIERQTQIYFRFLFRIFIFAYSRNSIEIDVIDSLSKANVRDGCFQLARYSATEFAQNLRSIQSKQRTEYLNSKTLLLKLLQKDFNLTSGGRVHFSIIRTLGCFLSLQISSKSGYSNDSGKSSMEESHRINSETGSLQLAIFKISRLTSSFINKQKANKKSYFTKRNQQLVEQQIGELLQLYFKAYGRKLDLKKFDDVREHNLDRAFNIRGQNADFTYSVETYKKDISQNCWKAPLKDSQFQFLYDILYAFAKAVDKIIPGGKPNHYPRINLRCLCNPIFFILACLIIIVLIRILL